MPRPRRNRTTTGKSVETLRHEADTRINIPTAEYQSLVREGQEAPMRVAYERRNRDLDPQLVWQGKDEQGIRCHYTKGEQQEGQEQSVCYNVIEWLFVNCMNSLRQLGRLSAIGESAS